MYITRVAPSPSGNLHLGTARTAYFNWLAAKASGGKFILRIDDTDAERTNEDYVKIIYDALAWLGLDHDMTFRQSENKEIYLWCAEKLIEHGLARRQDSAVFLNIKPDMLPKSWHDSLVGDVPITDQDKEVINNLVLIRSDGFATYHFSSVLDDIGSGVNFIIRGQDHLANTAKHIAIYLAIRELKIASIGEVNVPKFAHVGLIHKDKKKMSKRDGAASLLDYRDKGYHPDAVLNFMLRLGWSPQKDDASTAIIDKKSAINMFLTHGRMKPSSANFDQARLDSFDRKYKHIKEKKN